jgi:serine protease Do
MLLKNGRSQSTVGSGFLVGTSNLVLTNYHVVSQMALDPDVYVGEYVDTDGKSGPVELLAVDVLHDLAVVRVNRNGTGFFKVPDKPVKLTQGQYLYSLGNPLDLGFAISEGAYNGVVTRSFYDQLMFTGPINSGMSGGPSVTASGTWPASTSRSAATASRSASWCRCATRRNCCARWPRSRRAAEGLQSADRPAAAGAPARDDRPPARRAAVDQAMGPYQVPVRESSQVRCWGRSNVKAEAELHADTISCAMESAIYVSDNQQTGHVSMTHQYVRSASLHPLRFAALASSLFRVDPGQQRATPA